MKKAILIAALVLAPAVAQQVSADRAIAAIYSDLASVTPQQREAERSFAVDSAQRVTLLVAANAPDVDVALIDPSGTVYVSGQTNNVVIGSTRQPGSSSGTLTQSFTFVLENPPAGVWKYRVSGPSNFTGVRVGLLTMATSSDLVAGLVGLQADYPNTRPVSFSLVIADTGGGIRASSLRSINAFIRPQGGARAAVAFKDDGVGPDQEANDGVYTATFNPTATGEHAVGVVIEGVRNGQTFMRTANGRFRVYAPCGSLSPNVTSRTLDLNSNGRPDELEVRLLANVARAATVHVQVELKSPNGKVIHSTQEAQLTPGPSGQSISVHFSVPALRAAGADGPYQISEVRLSCLEGKDLVLADRKLDLGSAGTFTLAAAERKPIELRAPHTDRGVDTNSNGLFERLEYGVGLDLLTAGTYQWSASLVDGKGNRIAAASSSGNLPAGAATALLPFEGTSIGASGVDGPYTVRGFVMNGTGGISASVSEVGTTQAYLYEKFEGSTPRPAGPRVFPGGVVNGASFQAASARGMVASLFGTGFATNTIFAETVPLPTTLGGVRVSVNGVAAPLFALAPGQINFQMPFETPLDTEVPVVVTRDGVASPPVNIVLSQYALAVFSYSRTANARDPIILHADGSLVTPDHPALAKETLVAYATGAGSIENAPATGELAPSSPLAASRVAPSITVGDRAVRSLFTGLTPGSIGLAQINLLMPDTLPPGNVLPLTIRMGSYSQTVNLAVR